MLVLRGYEVIMSTGDVFRTIVYIIIVVIFVVTGIQWVRLHRKASWPHLTLRQLLAYPKQVVGNIAWIRDGYIEASYQVDGVRYTVEQPIEPLERVYVETSLRTGREVARHTYMTTTLGEVSEGGEIRVRYRADDPREALLRPNPVVIR